MRLAAGDWRRETMHTSTDAQTITREMQKDAKGVSGGAVEAGVARVALLYLERVVAEPDQVNAHVHVSGCDEDHGVADGEQDGLGVVLDRALRQPLQVQVLALLHITHHRDSQGISSQKGRRVGD